MQFTWSNFKSRLAGKSRRFGALVVLCGVLVILVVRNVTSHQPRAASAALTTVALESPTASQPPSQVSQRLRQSQELWKVLREVRGIPADQAFRFDSTYYMVDPARRPASVLVQTPGMATAPQQDSSTQENQTRSSQVKEQVAKFVLQSTVMGTVPVAVINGEVVRAGDRFQGFRIVAIRARQVLVEKDGVTATLDMAR